MAKYCYFLDMQNTSSGGADLAPASDPGPITGLVLLSLLGCAMAYHLWQLSKRGAVRRVHPIGFCLCYVCVLAYAMSDTVGTPAPAFLQLLGIIAALWFAAWCFAAVVQERFGCCAGRDPERERDPEDRSIFADDL